MNDVFFKDKTVAVVDDELHALCSMEVALNMAGVGTIKTFDNSDNALEYFKNNQIDCAVLDLIMPGKSGRELLAFFNEHQPDTPVIMATGVNDIVTAVECMKAGASDYIVKPLEPHRFMASVSNVLKIRNLQKENENHSEMFLSPELKHPDIFAEIITENFLMKQLFKYVEAIASTPHCVLITGETGVGKERFAKAIHDSSGLKGEFVAVNVAGLDDTIFSDTLFGHSKGAFTGAEILRRGLVEKADNGTLFLDEIGELSVQSQIKLLRLIQEHEYYPLGSDMSRKSNARIIAATCKPLEKMAGSDDFRSDLYYRLRTHHIHIPPLRERKDDIPLLATYYINSCCKHQNKNLPKIPVELFPLLKSYHFPGNIRELQSMIYDAVSTVEYGTLSLNIFRSRIGNDYSSISYGPQIDNQSYTPGVFQFPEKLPLLKEMEDMLIAEAMERADGNQTTAATLLGVTRQALGYRLKNIRLK